MGVLVSALFIVFSLCLGLFTLEALNWASEQVDCDFNIHILSRKVVGRWADILFQISIILTNLGGMICNIISSSTFFIITYGFLIEHEDLRPEGMTLLLTKLVVALIVSFTFFLNEITALRYLSFASLSLLTYLMIVMIAEAPSYINDPNIKHDYHWVSFDYTLEGFYKLNAAFTTFTFAFLNHPNILPIKNELFNRNPRRTSKIILRAELGATFFFAIITFVGYFSLGQTTPELIFSRESIGKNDYFMKIGMLVYGLYLLTCVPHLVVPCKIATTKLLGLRTESKLHQILISFGWAILVLLFSVFFSQVTQVLNIVAGAFATYISVTGPSLIFIVAYHKFSKEKKGFLFFGGVLVCSIVTLLGITSTFISIYLAFAPSNLELVLV